MWKSWYWKAGAGHILDPIKHLWWSFIAKIFCKGSNYFGNSYVNLDYYLYDPAWMSQIIKVVSHDPVKYSEKVQIILEIHTSTWIITCMIQRECPKASRSCPMILYIIVFDLQRNHMKISYWCGLYKWTIWKKYEKQNAPKKSHFFLSVCNIILRNSCLWISFWFSAVNYFWNTHHLRCLTEFWKRLWSPKTHNRFSNSNWFLSFQFLYILHLP